MRLFGIVAGAIWFTVSFANAQVPIKTLRDLIEIAKTNLPVLKQKLAQVNVSRAAVTDVEHSFLPQVRASAQYSFGSDNSISGSTFPFSSTISTSGGIRAENKLEPATGSIAVLYGEYEVYNFGLNAARRQAANAFIDLNQSDYERELYFLEFNVAKTYFNFLKNYNKLNTDKQNIQRYENLYVLIRTQVISGLRPGSDTSSAKAEISKARIGYNQTLGAVNQTITQLAYFTGNNLLSFDQLALNFEQSVFKSALDSQLIAHSSELNKNPLIEYLYKRKNIFDTNERVIEKSFSPKIILGASVLARGSSVQYNDNYQSLLEGFGYQRFNYVVGAAVNYNLLNNLYRRDKIAINKFQIESINSEIQQQVETLHATSLQAENALQTAQANLLEIPIQIQVAQETFTQKSAQYKSGLISLNDLKNSAFVLFRAQSDEIDFQNDWYVAQLERAAAKGNLETFIQSLK